MHLLLECMSLKEGDHEWAAELLEQAGGAGIPEKCPELIVISLVSCSFSLHEHPDLHNSEDVWMEL
jgi:hypothetical protein